MKNYTQLIYKSISISILFILTIVTIMSVCHASFESKIFFYDDLENANGLHMKMDSKNHCDTGDQWYVKDLATADVNFLEQLLHKPEVIKNFTNGRVFDQSRIHNRTSNSIHNRFGRGHPHGMMCAFIESKPYARHTKIDNSEGNKSLINAEPFMYLTAGFGNRPGATEIAFAWDTQNNNIDCCKQVTSALVNEWAPEVRRIGLGQNLNPFQNQAVVRAFRCFSNNSLDQLDATVNSTNTVLPKILTDLGFTHAYDGLQKGNFSISYDRYEHNDSQHDSIIEDHLLKLYNAQYQTNPLKTGQHYLLIDEYDQKRTFSRPKNLDHINYHFSKQIN